MNRLGRGYSFEALRAKILFSEGVHKIENKRPKFERKVFKRSVGYALPDSSGDQHLDIPAFLRKSADGDTSTQEEKNYGADISTLIELIQQWQQN